jgi:PAS domain S-box-containing protein
MFFPTNFTFVDMVIPQKKRNYILYAVLLSIGVFLFVLNFFHPVVFSEVIPVEDGWRFVPATSSLINIIWISVAAYTFFHILGLLMYWRRRTKLTREKKQIALFCVSGTIAIILAFIEFEFNHLFLRVRSSPLTPVMLMPWILGMVYAVKRYRFLNLTPKMVTREILQSINELVILVNMEGKVTYMNRKALEFFNSPLSKVAGTPVIQLLEDSPNEANLPMAGPEVPDRPTTLSLKLKDEEGNLLPLQMNVTRVNDQWHDPLGFLFIGREEHAADYFMKQYGLTPQESNVVRGIMRGRKTREIARKLDISERTVKAHITHIYTKVGVSNRVELVNRLKGSY